MPNNFTEIDKIATIIAMGAGIWGAVLSFFRRDTKRATKLQKVGFFLMDMFVNVGITMLIYLGLIGYGVNDLIAVAVSGFGGHQGVRSIYLIELIIAEKLGAQATFKAIQEDADDDKK